MSATATRWPKATREHPCPACGHTNACKIAPDGTAAACWHNGNGGKVIQLAHVNGNGSNGHHAPSKPGKVSFCTLAEAIEAARRLAERNNAQAATLAGKWVYRSAEDEPRDLMAVLRFDLAGGDKQILPLKPTKGGGWAIGDPPEPLPLYRLAELKDGDPIFLTEGEKAALAAASIGLTTTTSSHGCGSASRTNWRPLAGRRVVILPDNDEPGEGYARDVCRLLLKLNPPAQVRIVRLPALPPSGDIVEFIAARRPADSDAIREEIEAMAEAAPIVDAADVLGGIVSRCLADVQAEEIRWAWPQRFALGKLSLLGGTPGVGKSWLSLFMATAISRALAWPDGRGCAPLGRVLIANAEDGAGDTIKPRLMTMGADCSRIHVLDYVRRIGPDGKAIERGFTLADVEDLEAEVRRLGDVRAVVIDPISAHLAGADEYKNGEVRALLKPLAKMAERTGTGIILITHLTKTGGPNSVHRMIGSIGFAGACRSVWLVAKDPKNPARRLLLMAKSNIAADPGGLAYSIVDGSIAFERDAVQQSADDVLAEENSAADDDRPGPEPVVRDMAREWLQDELADLQEHPVATLREQAKAAGLGSWKSVQRAGQELGILSHRATYGGGYVWRLPRPGTLQDTPYTHTETCPPVPQGKNPGKSEDSAGQVPLAGQVVEPVPQGVNGHAAPTRERGVI